MFYDYEVMISDAFAASFLQGTDHMFRGGEGGVLMVIKKYVLT